MQDQAALLKRAIIQGVSERYERELSASKAQVRCSDAHMDKMSEILGFDVKSMQKKAARKGVIAALLLAAALAIGSLTVYANREKIRDLLIQVFEKYIILEFTEEQVSPIVTEYYEVGYIPEGYELIRERYNSGDISYRWMNENEETLTFAQYNLNVGIQYDAELSDYSILNHKECKILCVKHENSVSYTWTDGKYALDIHDMTCLPIEEILKIIDSIHPKK
ncbi:MAG: DUF4367 domain-containing protein [Clostridia bacterium]|nr:DUF4367 domain-containing protein [Clostridia bacterium]